MKLRITRKAARYCKGYFDRKRCLVATAARFQFPNIKNIHALGTCLIIGRKEYAMVEWELILPAYDSAWKKIRPGFEPFTVELTRV